MGGGDGGEEEGGWWEVLNFEGSCVGLCGGDCEGWDVEYFDGRMSMGLLVLLQIRMCLVPEVKNAFRSCQVDNRVNKLA